MVWGGRFQPPPLDDEQVMQQAAPPTEGLDATGEMAVQDVYTKLRQQMDAMSGVNYDEVFAPYMEKIRGRELPKPPGRAEAFARAFGSQGGSASVMGEIAHAREAVDKRDADLMITERDLLEAKVQQEAAKGDAAKALKTLEMQKGLEEKLKVLEEKRRVADEDVKRQKDWEYKQKEIELLFGKRESLERVKSGLAMQRARDKIKAYAQEKGIDPNKLLGLLLFPLQERIEAMHLRDSALEPREVAASVDRAFQEIVMELAGQIQELYGPKDGGGKESPPAERSSRLVKRAREIQAGKGK